jgi:phage terminase small subunit
MTLTRRQTVFIEEYLNCWNAAEAARRAGYSVKTADVQGSRLLGNVSVAKEIERQISDRQIKPAEVLQLLTEQARSKLSDFYRASDRWTQHPLTSDEIIDERDTVLPTGVKVHEYLARRMVLDAMKLTDPNLSRLVRKYSNTKNGVSIELHDAQAALEKLGKAAGVLRENINRTGPVTLKVIYDETVRDTSAETT